MPVSKDDLARVIFENISTICTFPTSSSLTKTYDDAILQPISDLYFTFDKNADSKILPIEYRETFN